jgi:hypothetical protein
MTNSPEHQIGLSLESNGVWKNHGASNAPPYIHCAIDEGPHNSDGLLLHCLDGAQPVTAFISRHVMDDWADPRRSLRCMKSLYRDQYNALGMRNLPAIQRIVTRKYRRGLAFNRQHPFVDVLLADIVESGEVLNMGGIS